MLLPSFALLSLLTLAGYLRVRRRRARPRSVANDAVAGLANTAFARLLAAVDSVGRTADAVPAASSIWSFDGDNLLMKEDVKLRRAGIVDAAVDFAAVQARRHGAAPTEALVREWLTEGVSKSIGRCTLLGLERSQQRLKLMQQQFGERRRRRSMAGADHALGAPDLELDVFGRDRLHQSDRGCVPEHRRGPGGRDVAGQHAIGDRGSRRGLAPHDEAVEGAGRYRHLVDAGRCAGPDLLGRGVSRGLLQVRAPGRGLGRDLGRGGEGPVGADRQWPR